MCRLDNASRAEKYKTRLRSNPKTMVIRMQFKENRCRCMLVWENRKYGEARLGKSQTAPYPFGKISNRHLIRNPGPTFRILQQQKATHHWTFVIKKHPPQNVKYSPLGQRSVSAGASGSPAHCWKLLLQQFGNAGKQRLNGDCKSKIHFILKQWMR